MLSLFKSIWNVIVSIATFVIDTIRDFFEWMKRPGSKLKFVCGILAILFATFGLIAFEREQEVKRLNNLIISNELKCELIISERDANILGKDQALADISAKLQAEQDKLTAFRDESAREIGMLRQEVERMQMEETSWKERYNNRPKECRAALELLDSACPAMEDY